MEKVSVLMDGELDADDAARQIARIRQDSALREGWDAWHLIGDAMRNGGGGQPLSAQFGEKLAQRLALEPTVMAPRLRLPRKIQTYALSAAASVAAVAAVAWVAFSTQPTETMGTLASAPTVKTMPVALAPPPLVSQPYTGQMQEYLLAHQGISPSTAIQGVAPYIRTVSGVDSIPDSR